MTVQLFRRLLGPAIDALPPSLRDAHDSGQNQSWTGRARVEASRHPLARLLCRMMRLPSPGSDVAVTVMFERTRDGERWLRDFAGRRYRSTLTHRHGLMVERMGPATNVFRIAVEDGALRLDLVGFRFLGLPLPARLRPDATPPSASRTAATSSTCRSTCRGWVASSATPAGWSDTMTEVHPIIVFDGDCVLCSANAQFVLRHDRAHRFRLAAMQGEFGAALFRRHGIDPADPDTMIVVDGDRVLRDSDAVIAIYAGLGWPWRAAGAARMIPRGLRDPLYRWVARHRYRLVGRREACWLPRPEDADRVL